MGVLIVKPLIGIVCRIEYPGDTHRLVVNDEYRSVILAAGGNPFLILPPQGIDYGMTKIRDMPELTDYDKSMLIQQLNLCSGIVMPGGFKMANYDFFILDYAIKNNIPILGICLGMQEMANYGRDIEINKNDSNGINHNVESGELVHFVTIDKDSKLYSIFKMDTLKVNSFHKKNVSSSHLYKIVGYSEDGLVEAVEYPFNDFNFGVQWHPERMYDFDDASKRLFSSFIEAASRVDSDVKIYVRK